MQQEAAGASSTWQAKLATLEEKLHEADKLHDAHKASWHQRWVDGEAQKLALEASWQRRLLDAEQGQSNLRSEVHAKLLLVSERLEALVRREAKHAARRGESCSQPQASASPCRVVVLLVHAYPYKAV